MQQQQQQFQFEFVCLSAGGQRGKMLEQKVVIPLTYCNTQMFSIVQYFNPCVPHHTCTIGIFPFLCEGGYIENTNGGEKKPCRIVTVGCLVRFKV